MKYWQAVIASMLLELVLVSTCWSQGGYNDNRVMIQGFMWESSVDGKPAPAWSDYEVHWKGHGMTK